ncbi:hypothetical protein Patl1_30957 [Pistacia atlantica]|uniref:Uncharacterized protein n=1 Tax=Pistacia atlantica TaxID=434234 RepID=A0ACC1A8H1_9ROSI|nr:hypothetical protein Patl1_30957 [Pistacia atlantica]
MATDDVFYFNIYDHGTLVDRKKRRVQCNYCGKEVSGSCRLKYHLGGIRGDVIPCEKAPENVKETFRKELLDIKKASLNEQIGETKNLDSTRKQDRSSRCNGVKRFKREATSSESRSYTETESELEESETQSVSILSKRIALQTGINAEKKKDSISWETQKCIGRFFYEMGIDFSVVNSSSFRDMINAPFCHGQPKCEIPSFQDLKGWILHEEVKEMEEYVKRIRQSWASTGCSILLDGWIDENGRNLVSFIVDCPQGPIYLRSADVSAIIGDVDALQLLLDGVIEEVGVNNVFQIIACSTSGWMGDIGKQFMERRRSVFWTVSASHCIELMLEKIGMMDSVQRILDKTKTITRFIHGHASVLKIFRDFTGDCNLIKPSIVRSAMPYMTLENIVLKKKNVMAMFVSSEWNTSNWATTTEGTRVANLVKDHSFWGGARMVLKATIPLVRVLCLIIGADKPQVGYMYETMDQAKETIKEEFNNKKSEYMPVWKIIDEIWDKHLHSPLHAAGYYLNPSFFYSSDFFIDPEVSFGLLCCIVRMVQDQRTQDLISLQLDEYRHAKGAFSLGSAIDQINKYSPAEWWSHFGEQYPELRKFATRILSQTCDGASKYSLKRNLSEKLMKKGRNRIEEQRLSDLTFVHYNLQLKNSKLVRKGDIVADEIDPMDDWIVDESSETVSENGDCGWMELNYTKSEGVTNVEGASLCQAKEEPSLDIANSNST